MDRYSSRARALITARPRWTMPHIRILLDKEGRIIFAEHALPGGLRECWSCFGQGNWIAPRNAAEYDRA